MCCVFLVLVLLFPRIALVVMYLTSHYLERAYHHAMLIPLLGFIFLPLTTLVYAYMVNSGMPTEGAGLIWIILAVIIDLGGFGGGYQRSRRY
jgi:hypothetical protein